MIQNTAACPAIREFTRQVQDFLSGGPPPAKTAAAMLILAFAAHRRESGRPETEPLALIRGAYAAAGPAPERQAGLEELFASLQERYHRSAGWTFYLRFRENTPAVRRQALALLAGGFWTEFFLEAADAALRAAEEEGA